MDRERSIRIERKAYSPASMGDLFIGFFFLAWFILVLLVLVLGDKFEKFGLVLLAVAGILMTIELSIGFDRARPATFEMDEQGVRLRSRGRSKEMPWGPEVTVDVLAVKQTSRSSHSDLKGYRFLGDHLIEIEPREGWRIEDIREAWEPLIDIVGGKDVRLGDTLVEYQKERGMA